MKKIYFIVTLLTVLLVAACQSDDEFNGAGYLRLNVETNAYVHPQTKVSNEYNPKQITIQIIDASGKVVQQWDDHTTIGNSPISLKQGTYTINASSNGFDGSESGYNLPYYAGSKEVTVEAGKEVTAEITCTLANVKVTVNFDQSFIDAFKSAKATVTSQLSGVNSLDFVMGTTTKSGYFPVGDLNSTISVVNQANNNFSQSNNITGVKARDHYILNYKVAERGDGSVSVVVDGSETIYTFEFAVSTEVKTNLEAKKANAWNKFAYVEGEVLSTKEELDPSKMLFEYKAATVSEWTTAVATKGETTYTGKLTGLTTNTKYTYRMVYRDSSTGREFISNEVNFTTEEEISLPNGNFDDWCTVSSGALKKKTYYAATSYDSKFWDSGNKGANTLSEVNPTRPEETDVIKGKAAKLSSTTAAGQFAAGSLFTGDFGSASINPLGAKLNFGRPFTGRPSQLTGYYKYNPGNIDYFKKDKVSAVAEGDRDICSIYIALTDWTAPFAVSTGDNQFVDFTSSSIIAYGELPENMTSPESMSEYKKFTIDIKYRDLTRKPTYILVVCSSSKYGDFFTGSTSSVLLLDEFQLVYDEPVVDTNYIK